MTGDEAALVRSLVAREREHMTRLRRHLHQHPELAYQERETAARVEHELRSVGFTPTRPTETSIVCRVPTGRPGPVLVLRADMDALPVREDTGHSFASRNDGVMHACGHDGHMAVLVGVARAVRTLAGRLAGEVRLLFQHAEEPLPSGAPELIGKGVLDGADAIVGLHLWSSLPLGRVCASAGPLMASTDYFDITITGRGGHAGLPHDTVDPIAAGAHTVTNLRQIVARESNPADALVVAVTGFHGGEHNAVVPETARLYGTVRALDERVRRTTADRITRIARSVAATHRAEAEVAYTFGSPAVVNDPTVAAVGQRVTRQHLGDDALVEMDPIMAGEDFAWYQERIPGLFLLVGAGRPDHPHHHPRFDFDEDALGVGMTLLLGIVLARCGGSPHRPHR
ncbi:amidohydrolase [Streptomyces sp. B6B3]|uniref:M20 metallopeptidase family protein n=1 Tax=Streptomyces sp. B6B3 TaxID=3153570 RepID=UPI00325D2697